MRKNLQKIIIVLCPLIFLALFLCPVEALALDPSTPTWTIPTPKITIPGMKTFSPPQQCTGSDGQQAYCIPWIGEYLAAIYKYAIGIVGIVAAIMLMVGGIVWLTAGGNATQVSNAQSYITASLTGLVLALLSYTLLYTINPDLVSFKPIKVKMVANVPISGMQNCTWMDSAQCDSNYGYTTGNCGSDYPPGCEPNGEFTSQSSSCNQKCCCTTTASTGCSWSNDSTCGNNAQQISDYSKCGTNTGKLSTCCCNWPGTPAGAANYNDLVNKNSSLIKSKQNELSNGYGVTTDGKKIDIDSDVYGLINKIQTDPSLSDKLYISTIVNGHNSLTANGGESDHGFGQGIDIKYAGDSSCASNDCKAAMSQLAQYIHDNPEGVTKIIYAKAGDSYNQANQPWLYLDGKWNQYKSDIAGHTNHIHISTK